MKRNAGHQNLLTVCFYALPSTTIQLKSVFGLNRVLWHEALTDPSMRDYLTRLEECLNSLRFVSLKLCFQGMYENNLGLKTSALNVKIDALSNLTWKRMKRKVRQYFVERCMNYCQGFNKCMKKEKGEINTLV